MKASFFRFLTKTTFMLMLMICCLSVNGQDNSDFWQKIRFGGSFGLGIGNGYTDVMLAPSAIYEINPYFSTGLGIQGSYVKQRNYYSAFIYGGSVIGIFNPIEQVQLSAEVEQLRVNLETEERLGSYERDFWNTALFVGAGYRAQNVTIGVRYNVLYKKDDLVYSQALMPFVRVYF